MIQLILLIFYEELGLFFLVLIDHKNQNENIGFYIYKYLIGVCNSVYSLVLFFDNESEAFFPKIGIKFT